MASPEFPNEVKSTHPSHFHFRKHDIAAMQFDIFNGFQGIFKGNDFCKGTGFVKLLDSFGKAPADYYPRLPLLPLKQLSHSQILALKGLQKALIRIPWIKSFLQDTSVYDYLLSNISNLSHPDMGYIRFDFCSSLLTIAATSALVMLSFGATRLLPLPETIPVFTQAAMLVFA